ncbi:flavin reductase family protein [Plantibacter sp. YIM 135347]|uniref:flavin reductase family protein n=1 Tax=Plantibacter sp. YIM 135347 TaxID=3423919 RepID=UPI003D32C29C
MSGQTNLGDAPPQLALRRAFSLFPTGVVAVCALVDDAPVGIAVNSFTSVSLDPPLVAVCVARTSNTWPILAGQTRLGMSILGSHHEVLCRKLASRNLDRFEDEDWHATEGGAVLMDGAALWLECEVRASYDGGDHEIVVLEVLQSDLFPDVTPLVFHQSQFRGLLTDK